MVWWKEPCLWAGLTRKQISIPLHMIHGFPCRLQASLASVSLSLKCGWPCNIWSSTEARISGIDERGRIRCGAWFLVGFRKVSAASHFLLSMGCGGGWLDSFLGQWCWDAAGAGEGGAKSKYPTLCCVLAVPSKHLRDRRSKHLSSCFDFA